MPAGQKGEAATRQEQSQRHLAGHLAEPPRAGRQLGQRGPAHGQRAAPQLARSNRRPAAGAQPGHPQKHPAVGCRALSPLQSPGCLTTRCACSRSTLSCIGKVAGVLPHVWPCQSVDQKVVCFVWCGVVKTIAQPGTCYVSCIRTQSQVNCGWMAIYHERSTEPTNFPTEDCVEDTLHTGP